MKSVSIILYNEAQLAHSHNFSIDNGMMFKIPLKERKKRQKEMKTGNKITSTINIMAIRREEKRKPRDLTWLAMLSLPEVSLSHSFPFSLTFYLSIFFVLVIISQNVIIIVVVCMTN